MSLPSVWGGKLFSMKIIKGRAVKGEPRGVACCVLRVPRDLMERVDTLFFVKIILEGRASV